MLPAFGIKRAAKSQFLSASAKIGINYELLIINYNFITSVQYFIHFEAHSDYTLGICKFPKKVDKVYVQHYNMCHIDTYIMR